MAAAVNLPGSIMPKDFNRSDRIADSIQRSLAQHIRVEVRDPRLHMVNINSVTVAKDLSLAKVFVTFVGTPNDQDSEASVEILNRAANYLRNFVAKDLNTRSTPRLQFFYDRTAVHGQALSSLIDKVVAQDREKQAEADGSNQED